jgi:hypothetical protein
MAVTITRPVCPGKPAAARSRRSGLRPAKIMPALPAPIRRGGLEHDAGDTADHDDGLPGQFRLAPAGRGSHDFLLNQVVARRCRTGRAQPWHLGRGASRRAAVPPSETNGPMTMAAAAQGAAMTIIAGW